MPLPAVEVRAAAERVLADLAATDPAPATPCDAIIGYGAFDLRLPVFCGELDRIVDYPVRGWLTPEPLPHAIAVAPTLLRTSGGTLMDKDESQ